MIIDAHVHLSDSAYGNIDILREQAREAGIEGAVAVPGGMMDVRRMTDYITGRAKPENPTPNNAYVEACCQSGLTELAGFFCVDPHEPQATELLENAFKRGFCGLKLSPLTHEFSFASNAASNLAACCGSFGYPVYSHVLFSPGASTTRLVALAKQFPQTNFILGHMGFGPADMEGLEAAASLDNFFLETSTGNFLHLQESLKKAGATKLIFGSEFPLSHPKAELEKILLLKAPASAMERMLGANIQTLVGWPPSQGR